MPEMDLRQPRSAANLPGITYSTCGQFTKNKERIQKFNKKRDSRYIYQSFLDKVYFQHDMNCVYFKDLPRSIASHKVL